MLILDEADRTLEMGFGNDVIVLAKACRAERQTMMFSATAGGNALRALRAEVAREPQFLQLNRIDELSATTRQQIVTADDTAHKERIVQWLLAHETFDKAIIFTNTRVQADRLGGVLQAASAVKAYVLHGEKEQDDRKQAIERLRRGHIRVLVATDVAARGLDIDGMDLVINFDMPRSGDDYVHRIGRTGRAGAAGLSISLIAPSEWNLMSSIERYLKQRFERRIISELKGSYQGPKKLKSSGKAAGPKKKKTSAAAATAKKPHAKVRKSKGAPKRAPISDATRDGLAPPKRKPRQSSDQVPE
jgi:superfamily II DNA/RNA helicase